MINDIYLETIRRVMDKDIHKWINVDELGRKYIDRHIKIRDDLWRKCEELGFNRSKLINELLDEFLTLYEAYKKKKVMLRSGFEPESSARKADMIGRATLPELSSKNYSTYINIFCSLTHILSFSLSFSHKFLQTLEDLFDLR